MAGHESAMLAMGLGDLFGGMATSSAHGALAKNCVTNGRMGVDGAVRAFAVNSVATGTGAFGAALLGMDPMAGAQAAQSVFNLGIAAWSRSQPCFAAGTPLLTPDGSIPVEQLKVGDSVLARDEIDPDGPVEAKLVEAVFVRIGRILHLHVQGELIRVTPEHPIWVKDQGWIPAGELRPGDLLSTHTRQWVPVEEVFDTGQDEVVW